MNHSLRRRSKVFAAFRVSKVLLAWLVTLAHRDLRGYRAPTAHRVLLAHKVTQARKVQRGHREYRA